MSVTQDIFRIEGISVSYGAAPVIHDINLSVKKGETFGLIGLNGAGKTTLIKAALGLKNQDCGTISVYGHPSAEAANRKELAYLPERFEPPWFLSGMEFIKFSLSLYKRNFDKQEVVHAAETLALDPAVLGRRVQTYSKGMRQKLGLMGTVLTGCNLMILDEPMSGLDPRARALVKDMLRACRKEGRTIFLSSHILADMDEICDRIAVLHEGVLRFVGTPADLRGKTGAENLERAFLHFIEGRKVA